MQDLYGQRYRFVLIIKIVIEHVMFLGGKDTFISWDPSVTVLNFS